MLPSRLVRVVRAVLALEQPELPAAQAALVLLSTLTVVKAAMHKAQVVVVLQERVDHLSMNLATPVTQPCRFLLEQALNLEAMVRFFPKLVVVALFL